MVQLEHKQNINTHNLWCAEVTKDGMFSVGEMECMVSMFLLIGLGPHFWMVVPLVLLN